MSVCVVFMCLQRIEIFYLCVCKGLKYSKVVSDWLISDVRNHTRWRTFADSVLFLSSVESNLILKERSAAPGMMTSLLPKFGNPTNSN